MQSVLNHDELERLTAVWETWAQNAQSPNRFIGRARLHLFFLLARYAGLRSSEIAAFSEQAVLDRQTGLLQLKDRKLFLPPAALRPIRRILALPEAEQKNFLRLDAGFLRRTFYEAARLAGLKPEACAPRALRYARALELLEMHMPLQSVASCLGIANPLHIAQLAASRNESDGANRFTAILSVFYTDYRSGKLILQLDEKIVLTAITSLGELADIEPAAGKPLTVFLPPGLIFPSLVALPMENCLHCKLVSLTKDSIEYRLELQIQTGQRLTAVMDASLWDNKMQTDMMLNVYIPAHAPKVTAA